MLVSVAGPYKSGKRLLLGPVIRFSVRVIRIHTKFLDPLRSPFELDAKWKTRRIRRLGLRVRVVECLRREKSWKAQGGMAWGYL